MARRKKRRTRARRIARRAARRARRRQADGPSRPSRPSRARLSPDQAHRLLRRKALDPGEALLAQFSDPRDPLLQHLRPLVQTAARLAPRLLDHPALHQPLVLLALRRPQWVRPLTTWRPGGRGRERQFRTLVDHLLVRYPVPTFAYNAFSCRSDPNRGLDLFVHLAQGGSIRQAARSGLLPATLTRAMCHRLWLAPADVTLPGAVRFAQVAGNGGESWIARELGATFLGRVFGDTNEETFWAQAIHWLCRDGRVERGEVGHLVDYFRHRRELDPTFVVEARRLVGLVPQLLRWHETLRAQHVEEELLPCSGFAERTVDLPDPGAPDFPEHWELFELRNARAIAAEGHFMRHCVASYLPSVRRGTTSIWSLRRNGRRRVTIEVSNQTRQVVQIKGRKNRDPTPRELSLVQGWARTVGLDIFRQ